MFRSYLVFLHFFVFPNLLLFSFVRGIDYYVDINGNDSNFNQCLNRLNPCRTLEKALQVIPDSGVSVINILSDKFRVDYMNLICKGSMDSYLKITYSSSTSESDSKCLFTFDQILIKNCPAIEFDNLYFGNESNFKSMHKNQKNKRSIDFISQSKNIKKSSGILISQNSGLIFNNNWISNMISIDLLDSNITLFNNIFYLFPFVTSSLEEFDFISLVPLIAAKQVSTNYKISKNSFIMLENRVNFILDAYDDFESIKKIKAFPFLPSFLNINVDDIYINDLNITSDLKKTNNSSLLNKLNHKSCGSTNAYIYLNANNKIHINKLKAMNLQNLLFPLFTFDVESNDNFLIENSFFGHINSAYNFKDKLYSNEQTTCLLNFLGAGDGIDFINLQFLGNGFDINVMMERHNSITLQNVNSDSDMNCLPGYYNIDNVICDLCSPGYYKNELNSENECNECLPGTYSSNYGSSICFKCDPGTFCDSNKCSYCKRCYSDYVSSYSGQTICVKFSPFLIILSIVCVLLILGPAPVLIRYIIVRKSNYKKKN